MAKNLSLSGIQTGQAIEAKHVTQSIEAFTGAEAYDITVSGSLTVQGPVQGTDGTLNNFSASYASISTTASYAITASYALNGGSGGEGSVGTLQQVMESGSITTLTITASAGISSSGAIISPSFTGSLSGSALEAISSSYALTASHALEVISSSYALTASHALNAGEGSGFPFVGDAVITGSLIISSSNQSQSLQLYGSGSTIFSIEGSRGTLFSIDDDESDGKLFSVNNVSGTPVLEVHEDNTVKLGKQNGFGIVISGSNPLPNDANAKILITGSIYHSGSSVNFNSFISASSFNAPPGVINQLTASYAISASVEVRKEVSSSYADTASYVETAQTASYILASNINQPFTNITASGNISASGIINGLSGSFKSLDVFVNLPVTTGSKFRVGRMDSQYIGIGVGDYDNIILAKQDPDSNMPHNFILGRDFGGIGANNFKIQKDGIDQFIIDTHGNITASGNISASGDIKASNLDISGSATIDGPLTLTQANTSNPLTINNGTGTEIYFPGTLETNITSQGLFQFHTTNNQGYGFGVNGADFKAVIGAEGLATSATTVIADTYNGRLILRGNANPNQITGSIEITGSALTTTPDLIKITDGGINVINGNITASGNISASNSIIGNTGSFNRLEVNNSSFLSGSVDIVSSGSDILNVQGSQGQLFNIDDDLLHNLFLVTDISGESLFKISGSGLVEVLDGSITTPQRTINELTASHAMNVQPENNFMPITTHTTNFTSTSSYAGHYNIVGGTLSITVTTGSTPTDLTPGMEWNFFQTSSGDSFTFTEGTGVEIISRNNHKKLAAVGSAGTLKYISGQTFHLVGDLTI